MTEQKEEKKEEMGGRMKEGERWRKREGTRTRSNCPAINDTMLLRLSFFAIHGLHSRARSQALGV